MILLSFSLQKVQAAAGEGEGGAGEDPGGAGPEAEAAPEKSGGQRVYQTPVDVNR